MLLQDLPPAVLAGDAFGGSESEREDAHAGASLEAALLSGEAAAEALGKALA
jgi:hypothetical protein